MGFDKALIEVGGVPNAARLVAELATVAAPVVEVGSGAGGAQTVVQERPPGGGPLAAVCAGADALAAAGWAGPSLVVACDLPFVGRSVLSALARHRAPGSVVPLAAGRLQPLCARWSWGDLALARRLLACGERSMRALLDAANFATLGPYDWPPGTGEADLSDVDTPEDLFSLGLGPRSVAAFASAGAEAGAAPRGRRQRSTPPVPAGP
jgi:molybdopterin-guanine dinucleotide biosynthesis protein A